MGIHQVSQRWYCEDGAVLMLTADETATLLELSVISSNDTVVTVDMIQQPQSDQGVFKGTPTRIYRQEVTVRVDVEGNKAAGEFWLPDGLSAAIAMRCFYRVTMQEKELDC